MGFAIDKANISENNITLNIVVNKVGDTVLTTQVNLTRSYNSTGKSYKIKVYFKKFYQLLISTPTVMMDFNTSFGALPFEILTFLPNVTSVTFSMLSLQDEITEGIECLYFTLEPVDEFVDVPYGNETVTVCIEDDDRKF